MQCLEFAPNWEIYRVHSLDAAVLLVCIPYMGKRIVREFANLSGKVLSQIFRDEISAETSVRDRASGGRSDLRVIGRWRRSELLIISSIFRSSFGNYQT